VTRTRLLVLLVFATGLFGVGGTAARSAADLRRPTILYVSDWSGTSQIYAVDSVSGRHRQLTFGPAPVCRPEVPCGFVDPIPSPDGRHLLFSDQVLEGKAASLFVARADGRERRQLGQTKPYAGPYAAWSPDSRRIVFVGTDGVHVVDADGRGDRRVDHSRYDSDPAWSSDGRSLAFVRSPTAVSKLVVWRSGVERAVAEAAGSCPLNFRWSPRGRWIAYGSDGLYLVRSDGRGRRRLVGACGSADFAWSPNGRWLAYSSDSAPELDVVHPDGSGQRRLLASATSDLAWSADGHSLAFFAGPGLEVVDVANAALWVVGEAQRFAWSPRGRLLAFSSGDGIGVLDRAGKRHLLSSDAAVGVAWSPEATSLAYKDVRSSQGDLKVVSVSGRARTLVAAAGDYGGSISSLVWTRPPSGVRYRRPAGRTLAKLSQNELAARWPVERLAADGSRVAYVACGHLFVWTPAAKQVVQAEPTASLSPNCAPYLSYSIYSVALAGARVAMGILQPGVVPLWSLGAVTVGRTRSFVPLDDGFLVNAAVAISERVAGELAGAGKLLVFASLTEVFPLGRAASRTVSSSQVLRAEAGGCPCPTIASSSGTLVPLDVDSNRVVLGSDAETGLVDATGARLLTLPIASLAAQLSGSDLVVLVQGELRDYDANSGALRHAWPVPDVSSGRECSTPNGVSCTSTPRLILEDAARGLATYILDGQVHVLRLADGVDTTVGSGMLARFTDQGLVYAAGDKLRMIPFSELG
jgi:WD40-like Beta Propeller Repeat